MTLLFGLFLTLSSGLRDNGLYQVITSHPHDIEELNPYVDTVYQNGRLWIVELSEDAPKELREHLVPLSGREKSYFYRGSFVSNAGSWKRTHESRRVGVRTPLQHPVEHHGAGRLGEGR